MGCFCSKQKNGRVFDVMYELSGPTLLSQLHDNDSSALVQLTNGYSNKMKIIRLTEDDQWRIGLHQCRDLQLIPIEGNMKQFVYGRQGFYDEVVPNEGDVLFVMPFGTLPDIVLIEQGCQLSIAKIRTLLESVTLRLTRREAYAWRRRRLQPVSFVSKRWGPDYELPPDENE